ncbi:oxidoreductase [Streptomyces sp. CNQ-509]|uniref:WD40/YVTN/BNR-like repeat-containing protein n=1 Tax=Streptomyces sp. CNQ-509 TaxID=444103 RepID=UPI00062DDE9B|nr:oxidoreductase [Streptomyces sp. CNQ-509]AKH86149.1 oxidoreductase [Streptomyces sp. CNQ-509]
MTLRGTLRHRAATCLGVCVLAAGPVYATDTAAGADTGTDREPVARHLPGWELKETGSKARLRGLSAVSRDTAWVSGSGGTVLRTTDGGRSWRDVSPPGTEALEFRDIEALGRRSAVALSIGPGEDSRIYRTDDAGATWTETFRNDHPGAFYDCVTFFAGGREGLALSDPVDGRFRILSTSDGGRSWKVLPDDGMPPAQPGDAAFAASGQCLVSAGRSDAWFATGGGATARVLHSADRGRTWTEAESGIPAGDPARGVFALAFRDARHGLAVGGDFQPGNPSPDAAARTGDGGASWTDARKPPPEYRSGVAWLPHSRGAALAVGPTGSDVTFDAGRTWHGFDSGSYDTVDCSADLGCWAAGEQGRVARLE